MKKYLITILVFIAMSFSPLVSAQDNEEKMELAKKYVNLPGNQTMLDEMFSPEVLGEQLTAGMPPEMGLTEEKVLAVGQLMSKAMSGIRPEMEMTLIESSAEIFSKEELEAMIEFYSTEIGSSIVSKSTKLMQDYTQKLMPEIMAVSQEVGPELMEILMGE